MNTAGRSPGIGLVAPSGYVSDPAVLERIEAYFAGQGCRVVVDPTCRGRWRRFAGSDHERVEALHRLARCDDVDVVLAVRGGYGLSRILDRIDYAALAASGKIFAGHSDFTAFQLGALARAGMVSLAGPAGAFDFGGEVVDPFTAAHFWAVLRQSEHEFAVPVPTDQPGEVSGTIWGGNLSLLCHLVGTPYLPVVEGGVLFVEDVNEHPYRIERMLLQLHHAGILSRQRAILLGDFSGYKTTEYDNGYDLAAVVEALAERVAVPVLTGFPFGHGHSKVTVPVGARADLAMGRDGYRVRFSGYPTLGAACPAGDPVDGAFRVRTANWNGDGDSLRAVRQAVFVVEQGVPETLEWDDLDPVCRHAIAVDADGRAIGTGRLLPDGHIGRMAVLAAWRGRGVGTGLLRHLVDEARRAGFHEVVLNAQTQAMGFYERFGFTPSGEPFDEAGIPHREMRRRV